jgi:calcyphosin
VCPSDWSREQISKTELKYGLVNYGLSLTDGELQEVMAFFDTDKSGLIDFDEFLVRLLCVSYPVCVLMRCWDKRRLCAVLSRQRGMRGPMNERRKAMVDLAFNVLDRTGDGSITVEDLMDSYDVSWHPGVKNGNLTKEQALREFLNQWDRGERDGIVTREEFHEYMQVRGQGSSSCGPTKPSSWFMLIPLTDRLALCMQDVSASIDSDTYFELVSLSDTAICRRPSKYGA